MLCERVLPHIFNSPRPRGFPLRKLFTREKFYTCRAQSLTVSSFTPSQNQGSADSVLLLYLGDLNDYVLSLLADFHLNSGNSARPL